MFYIDQVHHEIEDRNRARVEAKLLLPSNMKQALLHWLLSAILTAAYCAPASAQTPTGPTPQAEALTEILFVKPKESKWRASLADALSQYCQSVLAQVPRNTPAEDKWAETEALEAIRDPNSERGHQRYDRLENSVENARLSISRLLTQCISIANNVLKLKQSSQTAEALLWLRLSRLFFLESDVWRYSEIIGLVSPSYRNPRRPMSYKPPPGAHDENNITFFWPTHGR